MKDRMLEVDIAKGLAALLVIVGHVAAVIVPFCGSVHIPLFFIMSGYVYKLGKESGKGSTNVDKDAEKFRSLCKKRFLRLIIPYGIYSGILLAKYVLFGIMKHDLTLGDFGQAVAGTVYSAYRLLKAPAESANIYGFTYGNGPLWFVTAMIVSSVVFYEIVIFMLHEKMHLGKLLASIGILVITSRFLLFMLPIYLPWSMEMSLLGAAFMLIGMAMREYHLLEKLVSNPKMGGILTGIAVVIFALLHYVNTSANMAISVFGKSMVILLVLGCLSTGIVYYISWWLCRLPKVSDFLIYVGRNSLGIVSLHMMYIAIWVAVAPKVLPSEFMNSPMWAVSQMLIGLIGAVVTLEILKGFLKIPERYL